MPDSSFSGFVQRSLLVLSREAPAAHRALASCMGTLSIAASVDHEALVIAAHGAQLLVHSGALPAAAHLATTRRALRCLLTAERTMIDAIINDELELRGTTEALACLDDCLSLYLRGAVRSPSFPSLLDEFLKGHPLLAATPTEAENLS
jgi:hypothetical protein